MHAAFGRREGQVDEPEPGDGPDGEPIPAESVADILGQVGTATGRPSLVFLRDEPESFAPMLKPIGNEDGVHPDAGKYSVQGEIARGGVGIVLKGHDRDLGRDVALKFLRSEYRSNPSILQRFIEEAQIGGQLQHPGIVPVYDLGVERGTPYFTMKLIKGRTLAALLEEREDPRTDHRRMLDIFESVCQTMAYAHARGVIHRDLKPANVMVGAFGEVHVVDWGLAKVLRTGGTSDEKKLARKQERAVSVIETVRSQPGPLAADSVSGSVMGTPSYMPPEQANGDVERMDERSDVFSLGAVLCEILTGRPPYPGDGDEAMDMARRCRIDGAKERLEKSGADAALVTLCDECFRPAPGGRPRSAQVLADRIAAHLQSVEERAESARIDAAKQRVRAAGERKARRLTLGLAASVLVTAGLGSWGYLAVDAAARERRTGVESKVSAALDETTVMRGRGDWVGALAAARRAADLVSPDVGFALRSRVDSTLDTARADASSAEVRTDLARRNDELLSNLANVRRPEGGRMYRTHWLDVARSYEAAFGNGGLPFGGEEQEVATRIEARGIALELAAFITAWAQATFRATKRDEAKRLTRIADLCDFDATRKKLREAFLTGDTTELKSFAQRPDLEEWPPATLELLGGALMRKDAKRTALRVYRRAQRVHQDDFVLTLGLARALKDQFPSRSQEAVRFYLAAIALRPGGVEVAHELGMAYEALDDVARALEVYEDAVAVSPTDGHLWHHLAYRKLQHRDNLGALEGFEKAVQFRPNNSRSHVFRGVALVGLRRIEDATRAFRRAIKLDPTDARGHEEFVRIRIKQKRYAEVITEYAALTKASPKYSGLRCVYGMALLAGGRHAEAVTELLAAIRLRASYALAYLHLGVALKRLGKRDEAVDALRASGRCPNAHARTLARIALEFRLMGMLDDAEVVLRKAIKRKPYDPIGLANLAALHIDKGEFDKAVPLAEKATTMEPKSAQIYYRLGTAQIGVGLYRAARASFQSAIQLQSRSHTLHVSIGVKWVRVKEYDAAITAFRQSIALSPNFAEGLCNLGNALSHSGHSVEGLPFLRKGHAIGSKRKRWKYPSQRWVSDARRDAENELRLVDIIEGEVAAVSAKQRLAAAALASKRGLYSTAVRLSREAFAADPRIVADLPAGARYDAACAAARGAAGRGSETRDASDESRRALRDQAIQWLADELEALRVLGADDSPQALARLRRAQTDIDLMGIRNERAVRTWPEADQVVSRKLWAAFASLIRKLED